MSDLPPLIDGQLQQLSNEITQMRRGGSNERQKPHKLLMLLAVLDLADAELLQKNQIYFDDDLVRHFESNFRRYADTNDWCQPAPPFFHLRTSSFWYHQVRRGREVQYAALATSGGGGKWILDNIEYAFLSEEAFLVVSHPQARQQLRQYISEMLTEPTTMSQRLKTVFHETFSLSRSSIGQVMSVMASQSVAVGSIGSEDLETLLRGQTHLGTRYVKAMPRYAVGAGLVTFEYAFTSFGHYALERDPLFDRKDTQWLMHYFLSAPHGPGPEFWNALVGSAFRTGNEFSIDDVTELIGSKYLAMEGKSLAHRSIRSTATVFLGTYLKEEGLGKLNLLEAIGTDRYRVLDPEPPSPWAFGYALLDYWRAQFGDRLTINLDALFGNGSLADLFLIGAGRMNMLLRTLQDAGYVDIYRVAPPYQVVLLRQDPESLLQKLYENDDSA